MEAIVGNSQLGAWLGGTVLDLAALPGTDTVLAATFTGISRSTDAGTSWQPAQADLPDWFIQAVLLAPMPGHAEGQPCIGLAASRMGWLYRSTDAGETWVPASDTRDVGGVTRLVASPNFAEDGIVFACTEEDGVFKSTDRGRTWKYANFGLLNLNVMTLCFSPTFAQDEVLYCGTDGGGLFRSRNAGRAWRESGTGLPNSAVQSVVVSPEFVQDGTLFAGTEDRGLYLSTDKGRTWNPVGDLVPETCINGLYVPSGWAEGALMLAATDAGLCASVDGGQHWQAVKGGPDYPYVVTHGPRGYLSGAYDGGVYGSSDGLNWETCNVGLAAHLPPLAAFSRAFSSDRCLLMGSMEGALVRSTDAGTTWSQVYSPGEEWGAFSSMASAGQGDDLALLVASGGELAFSGDAGASWRACAAPLTAQISGLALTGSGQPGEMLVGTTSGQVLASADGGASWETRALFSGEMVIALAGAGTPQAPSTFVVTAQPLESGLWQLALKRTASGATIYASEAAQPSAVLDLAADGGLTCALHERVVCLHGGQVRAESQPFDGEPITALAAAGAQIWAGSRAGLCRSDDGGRSWETVSSALSVVALHAETPERVYAVTMGGRIWEIED
jgi:photosystem II stability/assembly factor-like uncharacterized protein